MFKKINVRIIIIHLISVLVGLALVFLSSFLIVTYSAIIFAFLGNFLKGFTSIWALVIVFILGIFVILNFLPESSIFNTFNLWAGYKRTLIKKRFFRSFNKYKYEKIEPDFKPLVKNFLPFFVGFILLCVFSSLAINFVTGKIISRKIKEMKRKGYPTRFSDFHRDIAEEQNAAEALNNISILASAELKTFFEDGLNYEKKLDALLTNKKWDATKKKQAEIILSKCSYIFNKTELILKKYKYYQYVDYKKAEKYPFEVKFPQSIFPLRNLFLFRAKYNFKIGNYNLFWKDIKNVAKLKDLISQDKSLIRQMTSLSIISKICEVILNAMKEKPELVCSQDVLDELLKARKQNFAFDALKFETVKNMEELKYLARGDMTIEGLGFKIFFIPTGILNLNLIAVIDYQTKLLSFHSLSPITIKEKGKVLDDEMKKKPAFPFIWYIIPPSYLHNFYLSEAKTDTDVQILAVATAIRKYRMLNKKYPQKLSELAPKHLTSELIVDQFSEKELVYKLTKSGFLLYSIGRNFKDDNGTFGYYKLNNDIGVLMN
ncbi:MAG TPA: hypothetical protein DCX95_04935 [Elusimicrobia bacterium]|nr:hypothetical protein [Elusimicrobiota bacterium]